MVKCQHKKVLRLLVLAAAAAAANVATALSATSRFLTFSAKVEATSAQPISRAFFDSDAFLQACLQGTVAPLTPELQQLWEDRSTSGKEKKDLDFRLPRSDDHPSKCRVLTHSSTIRFPGLLRIDNTLVNGIQKQHDGSYVGILLSEERQATGPARGLYQKLTASMEKQQNHAASRISLNDNDMVHIQSWIRVYVQRPPFGASSAQRVGSSAIEAAVQRSLERGLGHRLTSAQEAWHRTRHPVQKMPVEKKK